MRKIIYVVDTNDSKILSEIGESIKKREIILAKGYITNIIEIKNNKVVRSISLK